MDTISEYKIVQLGTAELLVAKVSGLMKEGWQPLGGHTGLVTRFGAGVYQQTMVKYYVKQKHSMGPG